MFSPSDILNSDNEETPPPPSRPLLGPKSLRLNQAIKEEESHEPPATDHGEASKIKLIEGKPCPKSKKKPPAITTDPDIVAPIESNSGPNSEKSGGKRDKRKQKGPTKRGTKALGEIRKYQKSTQLLIPFAPFMRVCRLITKKYKSDFRWQSVGLKALQEASEAFLVNLFEGSYLLSIHGKRVTLMPRDITLYCRILGLDKAPNEVE